MAEAPLGWARTTRTSHPWTRAASRVGDGFGKDGVGMGIQIWPEYADNYGYAWQEIYLPTQTTAATFMLNFKFVPRVHHDRH